MFIFKRGSGKDNVVLRHCTLHFYAIMIHHHKIICMILCSYQITNMHVQTQSCSAQKYFSSTSRDLRNLFQTSVQLYVNDIKSTCLCFALNSHLETGFLRIFYISFLREGSRQSYPAICFSNSNDLDKLCSFRTPGNHQRAITQDHLCLETAQRPAGHLGAV